MDEEKLAAAFDEWMRRYRENPEQFSREFQSVQSHEEGTYGQNCASYLISLMAETA